MAIGSRRNSDGGYVFVDGRAVRADEAIGAPVQETSVPGRDQASAAPGLGQAGEASAVPGSSAASQDRGRAGRARRALRDMEADDAFALRDDALAGLSAGSLLEDDKRKMHKRYLIFGLVLLVCFFVSCCADTARIAFRSPVEVFSGLATWAQVQFASVFRPQDVADLKLTNPDYVNVAFQFSVTLKYAVCGMLLAVSGMLYQNAFRNPIAAPSMLGVTSGISFASLILVLQFGMLAYEHVGLYYLYSYVGGALVLGLVMLGGKWTSGKRKFNVVNMILIGTIVSQLLGVVLTYIQNNYMTTADMEAYNWLMAAAGRAGIWSFASLFIGLLVSLVPIFLLRFRLNLVSFSDEETKFLGVDPQRLRLVALGCGSVMILTAQVNAGQVAMLSLVVPFIVRAVFGSEFRKQLAGNILVGAILLIVCGLFASMIVVNGMAVGLSSVTTLIAMPLFVWMLAIRQRSWD